MARGSPSSLTRSKCKGVSFGGGVGGRSDALCNEMVGKRLTLVAFSAGGCATSVCEPVDDSDHLLSSGQRISLCAGVWSSSSVNELLHANEKEEAGEWNEEVVELLAKVAWLFFLELPGKVGDSGVCKVLLIKGLPRNT